LAHESEILGLAWFDSYQGLQKEDARLSKVLEKLDLPLGDLNFLSSCFLLLLAPCDKGERTPSSSNPYLLWMRAPRWSPWPSPAVASSNLLSFLIPSFSSLLECVRHYRERWTRERVGVWE
jgi:hypothetical protein